MPLFRSETTRVDKIRMNLVCHSNTPFCQSRTRQRPAKARGVRFGRERIERLPEFKELRLRYRIGAITCREAAKQCGVSHTTFLRWYKETA